MVIEKISEILSIAEKNIPKSLMPDQPISKYSNQPEWYGFEHIIWRSGDDIRLLLSENKNSQLSESQVRRIIDISINSNAKRGRQSFIMLLGRKKFQKHSNEIVSQIDDPDVAGHVVDTLLKMQAPEYIEIIEPFTNNKFAWIRNAARKYIERYGDK